ncbi:MAG: exodeoxyribonuclease V subunit gamma [Turneriella sp.]|nr:exodeoxyribonuclease V subunit gamma [Turneriella sp.]
MAFFYHQALSLTPLFPELYRLIKGERKKLKPQTQQTIIVGSLDVEAWIEEQFIERDGVLMGVHFPFLETTLESWLSPVADKAHKKTAGMLQLEAAVLDALITAKTADKSVAEEYDLQNLSSLQTLTLSQRIARELREYLLHAPAAMDKILRTRATTTTAKLWKAAHARLKNNGFSSGMLLIRDAGLEVQNEPSLFETRRESNALYLFGMPILSAYHIRRLSEISVTADVHLMGIHLHSGAHIRNEYYLGVAKKYETYAAFIRESVKNSGAAYSEKFYPGETQAWQAVWLRDDPAAAATPGPVDFLGLPGSWRAAEIVADTWHERLRQDAALRQDDFSLMLTDPAKQFTAFDKACGTRRLSLFARNRLFERPQPLVELMAILAEAVSGIDRDLLVRYFANAVVRDRFRLDAEKTELYIRALSEANGFRNDFTGPLEIFNLSGAINRLRRALLIDPATAKDADTPGAAYIRSFDSAETLAEFITCIEMLTEAPAQLKTQPGARAVQAWGTLLARFQVEPLPETTTIAEQLADIAILIPEHEISAAQIARMVARNTAGKSLAQSAQKQGICASPLSAPAPFRRFVTLWDMCEDLDKIPDHEDRLLTEYRTSPTRLMTADQVAIHLVQAALSGTETLQICYANFDPQTGAEKYRSVEIERFKASLAAANIGFSDRNNFAHTIFDPVSPAPALAANAEVRVLHLAHTKNEGDNTLAQLLVPDPGTEISADIISLKNLVAYVRQPFHFFYKRLATEPDDPAAFRFAEPKLAESKTSEFRFIDHYLRNAYLEPTGAEVPRPLALLAAEENRAVAEPEGFDFMKRLLSAGDNEQQLYDLAVTAQKQNRVIEYILDPRVEKPFTVREAERLTRYYLPAPAIAGIRITGTSDKFLTQPGENMLHFFGSSKKDDRTKELILTYVQLCVLLYATREYPALAPTGIAVEFFKITRDEKDGLLALHMEHANKSMLTAEKIVTPEDYLLRIVSAIIGRQAPYFDLTLLGTNNLGGFAAKPAEEILAKLESEREKAETPEFVAEFFGVKTDGQSAAFFDSFIRPIAAADSGKTGKKK